MTRKTMNKILYFILPMILVLGIYGSQTSYEKSGYFQPYNINKSNAIMTMSIDNSTYEQGQTINVYGKVNHSSEGVSVIMKITDPAKNVVSDFHAAADRFGIFSGFFVIPDTFSSGKYVLNAYYEGDPNKTLLSFDINISNIPYTEARIFIPFGASSEENKLNFVPPAIVVHQGTKIIWINTDSTVHTVISGKVLDNGSFSLSNLFEGGYIYPGQNHVIFPNPGNYTYFCKLHPWLGGTISVTPNPVTTQPAPPVPATPAPSTNSNPSTGSDNFLSIIWKGILSWFTWGGPSVSHDNNTTQSSPSQTAKPAPSPSGTAPSESSKAGRKDSQPAVMYDSNAPNIRIAIVEPTFTDSAYYHAFYDFYNKYDNVPSGVNITTDLGLLTANPSYCYCYDDTKAMANLHNQIKAVLPNATVTNLIDYDVETGHLFSNDQKNNFDVLILLKEEYLTQKMYDDYKHFVFQGGTIIFLNGNFFYAEISHDKKTGLITLVKGHSWEFDGKIAKRSVIERWFNETRDWVGSNFLTIPGASKSPQFANNVFNYTHAEENYVSNSKDIIILDYGAYSFNHPESPWHTKIATYELGYGKGKVIVVGLYGENLLNNQKFVSFFQHTILRDAVMKP